MAMAANSEPVPLSPVNCDYDNENGIDSEFLDDLSEINFADTDKQIEITERGLRVDPNHFSLIRSSGEKDFADYVEQTDMNLTMMEMNTPSHDLEENNTSFGAYDSYDYTYLASSWYSNKKMMDGNFEMRGAHDQDITSLSFYSTLIYSDSSSPDKCNNDNNIVYSDIASTPRSEDCDSTQQNNMHEIYYHSSPQDSYACGPTYNSVNTYDPEHTSYNYHRKEDQQLESSQYSSFYPTNTRTSYQQYSSSLPVYYNADSNISINRSINYNYIPGYGSRLSTAQAEDYERVSHTSDSDLMTGSNDGAVHLYGPDDDSQPHVTEWQSYPTPENMYHTGTGNSASQNGAHNPYLSTIQSNIHTPYQVYPMISYDSGSPGLPSNTRYNIPPVFSRSGYCVTYSPSSNGYPASQMIPVIQTPGTQYPLEIRPSYAAEDYPDSIGNDSSSQEWHVQSMVNYSDCQAIPEQTCGSNNEPYHAHNELKTNTVVTVVPATSLGDDSSRRTIAMETDHDKMTGHGSEYDMSQTHGSEEEDDDKDSTLITGNAIQTSDSTTGVHFQKLLNPVQQNLSLETEALTPDSGYSASPPSHHSSSLSVQEWLAKSNFSVSTKRKLKNLRKIQDNNKAKIVKQKSNTDKPCDSATATTLADCEAVGKVITPWYCLAPRIISHLAPPLTHLPQTSVAVSEKSKQVSPEMPQTQPKSNQETSIQSPVALQTRSSDHVNHIPKKRYTSRKAESNETAKVKPNECTGAIRLKTKDGDFVCHSKMFSNRTVRELLEEAETVTEQIKSGEVLPSDLYNSWHKYLTSRREALRNLELSHNIGSSCLPTCPCNVSSSTTISTTMASLSNRDSTTISPHQTPESLLHSSQLPSVSSSNVLQFAQLSRKDYGAFVDLTHSSSEEDESNSYDSSSPVNQTLLVNDLNRTTSTVSADDPEHDISGVLSRCDTMSCGVKDDEDQTEFVSRGTDQMWQKTSNIMKPKNYSIEHNSDMTILPNYVLNPDISQDISPSCPLQTNNFTSTTLGQAIPHVPTTSVSVHLDSDAGTNVKHTASPLPSQTLSSINVHVPASLSGINSQPLKLVRTMSLPLPVNPHMHNYYTIPCSTYASGHPVMTTTVTCVSSSLSVYSLPSIATMHPISSQIHDIQLPVLRSPCQSYHSPAATTQAKIHGTESAVSVHTSPLLSSLLSERYSQSPSSTDKMISQPLAMRNRPLLPRIAHSRLAIARTSMHAMTAASPVCAPSLYLHINKLPPSYSPLSSVVSTTVQCQNLLSSSFKQLASRDGNVSMPSQDRGRYPSLPELVNVGDAAAANRHSMGRINLKHHWTDTNFSGHAKLPAVTTNTSRTAVKSKNVMKARHFELRSLVIGKFEHQRSVGKLRKLSKVKLFFKKRKLAYEIQINSPEDACNTGYCQLALIFVPFDTIVRVREESQLLTVEVRPPVQAYLGSCPVVQGNWKQPYRYDMNQAVDVTDGEANTCTVHKVGLQALAAQRLVNHLWSFTSRFPSCGMSLPLQRRLKAKVKREQNLLTVQAPQDNASTQTHSALVKQAAQNKDTCFRTEFQISCDDSDVVTCTTPECGCTIASPTPRCPCSKRNMACHSQCLCFGCMNPLNQLQRLGVPITSAKADTCLIHNLNKVSTGEPASIQTYLDGQVLLPCCNVTVFVLKCIPGVVPCPNAPLCTARYQYSWCRGVVCNEDVAPRNHCSECCICMPSMSKHCQVCKSCYLPDAEGASCPRCHRRSPGRPVRARKPSRKFLDYQA